MAASVYRFKFRHIICKCFEERRISDYYINNLLEYCRDRQAGVFHTVIPHTIYVLTCISYIHKLMIFFKLIHDENMAGYIFTLNL